MFGRKKMYKKGLSDAMQAYEAFGKKQEEALAQIRKDVKSGHKKLEDALSGLGDEIYGIYDYLTAKEKAALYSLNRTPIDIKELDDVDKRLLLAVLYQLADEEGDALTDEQRAYIRSIQKYLEISNPQTAAELSAVENIDSLDVQKVFLQVALEFLYLQEGDELSDAQEEFLNCFSVNKKQAMLVEQEVSRMFNAVGAAGMAEKYGYVPEEVPEEETLGELAEGAKNAAELEGAVCEEENLNEAADRAFLAYADEWPIHVCIETENYIVYIDREIGWNFQRLNKHLYDKRTGKDVITFLKEFGKNEVPMLNVRYMDISPDECQAKFLDDEDGLLYFLVSGTVAAIDGDKIYYAIQLYENEKYQNTVLFIYDPVVDTRQKIFEYEGFGNTAVKGDFVVYRDKARGSCLLNLNTYEQRQILLNGIPDDYTCCFSDNISDGNTLYLINKKGVFSYNIQDKNALLIAESSRGHPDLHKCLDALFWWDYTELYFKPENGEIRQVIKSEDIIIVHGYKDGVLVSTCEREFPLYFVDAKSGKKIKIASECGYVTVYSGGLFRKSSSSRSANHFCRIGRTVYFERGDHDGICKVCLDKPMQIEEMPRKDESGRDIEDSLLFDWYF